MHCSSLLFKPTHCFVFLSHTHAPSPQSTLRSLKTHQHTGKMFPPPATATARRSSSSSSSKDDVLNEDAWTGEVQATLARARAHLDQKQQEAADKRRKERPKPKLEIIIQEEGLGKGLEKELTATMAMLQSSISPPTPPVQSMPLPQQPTPQTLHAPTTVSSSLPLSPPSFFLSPLDIRRPGATLLPAALPLALPRKRLPSLTQLPH
jgi:hypothetical protein